MIVGTKAAVRGVRQIIDRECGLPSQNRPCPHCGLTAGVSVVDDASDLVRCDLCLTEMVIGDVGGAIRTYLEKRVGRYWGIPCPPSIAKRIRAAKLRPQNARSPDETCLAGVEIEE
jgi:hypothetical protein